MPKLTQEELLEIRLFQEKCGTRENPFPRRQQAIEPFNIEYSSHTLEELYQGVKVRDGVYLVAMRSESPPRLMTGVSEGIQPDLSPKEENECCLNPAWCGMRYDYCPTAYWR